jgi:deoxyadenosine/deoxycytidine kinase
MKIAFTGTHGTGKSTLLNKILEEYPQFQGQHENFSDAGKFFQDKLLETLNKDALQLFFYARHLFRIRANKHLVSDRAVLDALCYAKYEYKQGNLSEVMLNFLEEVSFELLEKYDCLFWLRPEFELVGENKRPENVEFQTAIDKIFEEYMQRVTIPVIRLTGSVEERMQIIREEIKKYE